MARALRPGAQVDTVWCFEGAQGTFKSRALRVLGGEFHAELSAAIGTTDFQREMRAVWIAELSELDSLRGREASTIKRLLSAPADRFVQKYALHAESYPRRAVAVATTNEANYWEDPTGARRLVPIPCGEIRCDVIAENRLQWFAEARFLHAQGRTWWEFPTSIGVAQEDRQQVDPWEDQLRDYMEHGRRVGLDGMGCEPWPHDTWIATAILMRDWLQLEPHQQGKASGVRLAKIMRRLGYRPERSGMDRQRGWAPDTASPPESEVSA
jgi:putative DNA primase/helicase